jgi:hypothetical protein
MRTFQITKNGEHIPHFENGNGSHGLQFRNDLHWNARRKVIELPYRRGVLEGLTNNFEQTDPTPNASEIAE